MANAQSRTFLSSKGFEGFNTMTNDDNRDEDLKTVMSAKADRSRSCNIRRRFNDALEAFLEVEPRNMREAITVLNVLTVAQSKVLDYVNRTNNTDYYLKMLTDGKETK